LLSRPVPSSRAGAVVADTKRTPQGLRYSSTGIVPS
jgi:hypothetical protein